MERFLFAAFGLVWFAIVYEIIREFSRHRGFLKTFLYPPVKSCSLHVVGVNVTVVKKMGLGGQKGD